MKKRLQLLILIAVVGVFGLHPAQAGTTGKITGQVVDQTTGDPLPGANVVLSGTSLGAAADMDGQYTILYVPPGIYDLDISVIGYTKVSITTVRVRIDQTARVTNGSFPTDRW